MCRSRTEAIQKISILNSHVTVIHKNICNVAGNSKKVVHHWRRAVVPKLWYVYQQWYASNLPKLTRIMTK